MLITYDQLRRFSRYFNLGLLILTSIVNILSNMARSPLWERIYTKGVSTALVVAYQEMFYRVMNRVNDNSRAAKFQIESDIAMFLTSALENGYLDPQTLPHYSRTLLHLAKHTGFDKDSPIWSTLISHLSMLLVTKQDESLVNVFTEMVACYGLNFIGTKIGHYWADSCVYHPLNIPIEVKKPATCSKMKSRSLRQPLRTR
jgi:hypothetical protein